MPLACYASGIKFSPYEVARLEPLLLFVFVGGWGWGWGWGWWMLSTIFAVQALYKLAVYFFSFCCCVLFSPFSCPQISPAKAMQDSPFRICLLTPTPPPKKESQLGWKVWVVIYGDLRFSGAECILLRVPCAVYITIKKI